MQVETISGDGWNTHFSDFGSIPPKVNDDEWAYEGPKGRFTITRINPRVWSVNDSDPDMTGFFDTFWKAFANVMERSGH